MTAIIIFTVYVQRKAILSLYQSLLLETCKAILATILWLWLILDSAFGPWKEDWSAPMRDKYVARRVARVALGVIVLM
jgi:hypothetical protein